MDYVMGMRQTMRIRKEDLGKSKSIILIDLLFEFGVGVFNFCSGGWRGILNGIVMLRSFGACCFGVVHGGARVAPSPLPLPRGERGPAISGAC